MATDTLKALELAVVLEATPGNPDVGDLYLTDSGEEWLVTELGRAVIQRLTVRFNFFLNEWFLDATEGTPWFQRILVKAPSDRIIRTVLNNVIVETEGVASLQALSYSISRERKLTVAFKAILADNSTIDTQTYGRFQVDLGQLD